MLLCITCLETAVIEPLGCFRSRENLHQS